MLEIIWTTLPSVPVAWRVFSLSRVAVKLSARQEPANVTREGINVPLFVNTTLTIDAI